MCYAGYIHAEKPPQPLDLATVNKQPARYLPTLWQDICLETPTELKMAVLVGLYERIYNAQDGEHSFTFLPGDDTTLETTMCDLPRTPAKARRVTTFISPARLSRTATPVKSAHSVSANLEGLPSRLLLPTILEANIETEYANIESDDSAETVSMRVAAEDKREQRGNMSTVPSTQPSDCASVSAAAEGKQGGNTTVSADEEDTTSVSMAASIGQNEGASVDASVEHETGASASVASAESQEDDEESMSMAPIDEDDDGKSASADAEVEEEPSKAARTPTVKRKSSSQGTRGTTTKRARISSTTDKKKAAR